MHLPAKQWRNPMTKVSIIGAGNVGATVAQYLASKNICDIVMLDINEGAAKGKALDLTQAVALTGGSAKISGTSNYKDTANSQVIPSSPPAARASQACRVTTCSRSTPASSPALLAKATSILPTPFSSWCPIPWTSWLIWCGRRPASRPAASSAWPAFWTALASSPSSPRS